MAVLVLVKLDKRLTFFRPSVATEMSPFFAETVRSYARWDELVSQNRLRSPKSQRTYLGAISVNTRRRILNLALSPKQLFVTAKRSRLVVGDTMDLRIGNGPGFYAQSEDF